MGKKRSGRRIARILCVVLLFSVVPAETGWILNGAKADAVCPLPEDMEPFRSFGYKAERLAEESPFTEPYFRRAALEFLYGKSRVPFFFSLQLEPEVLSTYTDAFATALSDADCFPVGFDGTNGEKVFFENSWGTARNYGGDRRHEGVDIMTSNNVPGYFPAVSICDGTVEKIGWLELGGYRIGIRSEHGMYAYYAHLDSYRSGIQAGDTVKAGETLGYVGDSGYGKEGTKGKFDVHLHFGMYMDIGGKEVSINPYEILRYLMM